MQISKPSACITDYMLKHTYWEYPHLPLERTNLLEVCAVVVVAIQLRQLSAITDMPCEHPDACQVCVQLRSEDNDALRWHGL